MKVLIVSQCTLPVPAVKGGAIPTLLEILIAQNEKQKRADFTVVGTYDPAAEKKALDYPNTKFIFLGKYGFFSRLDGCIDALLGKLRREEKAHQYLWKLYVIAKLKKILRQGDYDRVVFQNSGYLLNVLKEQDIAERYRGKLFFHAHNDVPDNIYVQGLKQCKMLLISDYLNRKINQVCAQDMSGQTFVVKNGFRTELFAQALCPEERQTLLKKLDIPEDKKIVVFAGRVMEKKGVPQLIDAFIQLNREDTVLLIVGSAQFGSGKLSAFEEQLKRSMARLRERIKFTGFVPYAEMWKYYQLADVAVLPSMWEEPAGLTMLEAAAAGVPVVTTNSGGIPEYLNEELSVLLERDDRIVERIKNAVEQVFADPEGWRRRTALAQEYVSRHFSQEAFYGSFMDCVSR